MGLDTNTLTIATVCYSTYAALTATVHLGWRGESISSSDSQRRRAAFVFCLAVRFRSLRECTGHQMHTEVLRMSLSRRA